MLWFTRSGNNPLDAERVDRVARVALELGRAPLRQAALGALIALGVGGPQIDRELAVLDQRVAHVPAIAIDERALPELCDPEDRGPIPQLMRELATTFAEALGPGLSALGVGKKERVDPRLGLPLRNEIAAWAGALGLGDFDLYVGGKDPHGVVAIPGERPALVTGSAVTAPLSAMHRQLVARELFALRRGSTIVRHRDVTEIAALIVAACKLAGLDLPSPPYAMLGEFMRLVGKEMPRRVKKVLGELALPIVQSGQDPIAWTRAATSSLDRMAVIAAGDVSWVLGRRRRARPARRFARSRAARAPPALVRAQPRLPDVARTAGDGSAMSDQDRKPKPDKSGPHSRPGGPSAGRSGRAGSIGKELGELDFEPDALLDSLFDEGEVVDEDAEPTIAAEKPLIIEAPQSQKLMIPAERMYSADEVTLVHKPEYLRPVAPTPKAAPPSRAPAKSDADDIDALLEESTEAESRKPAESTREPPKTPRLAPPPARAPVAAPPRPAPSVSRPSPPRPASALPSSKTTAIGLNPPAVGPPPPPVRPAAATPVAPTPTPTALLEEELESLDEFDEELVATGMPTMPHIEPEPETIAATVESFSDSDWEARSGAPAIAPSPILKPKKDSFASLDEDDFEEISEVRPERQAIVFRDPSSHQVEVESRREELDESEHSEIEQLLKMDVGPPKAAEKKPRPPAKTHDPASGEERPAATHLMEQDVRDAWLARAEWLEAEAHALMDPHAKGRALTVASELWAMVGETSRAREAATEASASAPSLPLIQRQLRGLAAAEGDWRAVASALESEAKTSPSPESRAHAAYLSSEVHRVLLNDDATAQRKLDVAIRTNPGDPRAHVMKLSQLLGKSTAPPRMRWPEVAALAPLIDVCDELVRLRGGSVEDQPAAGTVGFEEARRALQDGDLRHGR